MRKKPDIVLLLSLFTIVGVLLSHFLVIQPNESIQNVTASLQDINPTNTNSPNVLKIQQLKTQDPQINVQDVVHIDWSKQQIR